MKREKFVVGLVTAALVGFALLVVPASAQKAPKAEAMKLEAHGLQPAEMQRIQVAVSRPVAIRANAVVEEFTGSFNDVDAHLASFNKEFLAQGLNKGLKGNPTSILIIYEDPTGKGSFRMAIGLEVAGNVAAKAPLKVEQLNEAQAIRYTHVGPYERLQNVHEGIVEHIRANKMLAARSANANWPEVLHLLTDPKKTPAAQLRTELIVPVK